MKLYPLSTKAVLAIRNNAALFLNGLTSNTPDKPRNAFVNIHGRIVATFDQYRVRDDEFVIAVERAFVEPLLAHLEKYVRLSGVRVEKLDRYVYFDLEETSVSVPAGTLAISQKKRGGCLLQRRSCLPRFPMKNLPYSVFKIIFLCKESITGMNSCSTSATTNLFPTRKDASSARSRYQKFTTVRSRPGNWLSGIRISAVKKNDKNYFRRC